MDGSSPVVEVNTQLIKGEFLFQETSEVMV